MSSDPAIQLRNVTKVYRTYSRPVDRLKEAIWAGRRSFHTEVRVLHAIDLDVERGQTVGIIGRNGSGKSTLLKIVAGTLQPTNGIVAVHGSVAALLELGCGFDPEQTGRANVYINACIHGLTQSETEQRYAAIAEFSELGEFLDRPVKIYSSGMLMRLAFATAIQVDRDILIVDEALSVGDAMFQRKCMATIESIKASGRTILFVSHSLETVKALCDRAVLLEQGQIVADGPPDAVTNEYMRICAGLPRRPSPARSNTAIPHTSGARSTVPRRPELPRVVLTPLELFDVNKDEFAYGSGEAEIVNVALQDAAGAPCAAFMSGETALICYAVVFHTRVELPILGITIKRVDGINVYGTNTLYQGVDVGGCEPGDRVRVQFRVPLPLVAGNYYVTLGCATMRDGRLVYLDRRCDALLLRIVPVDHVAGIADLRAQISVSRISASQAA